MSREKSNENQLEGSSFPVLENEIDQLLLFNVMDNAVGIAQEKIDEILKGAASSSEGTVGEHGFGFGLNLVYHLVTKIGGCISVSSQQGQGTVFELALPLY